MVEQEMWGIVRHDDVTGVDFVCPSEIRGHKASLEIIFNNKHHMPEGHLKHKSMVRIARLMITEVE